jgi:hypothetical protein
MRVFISITKFTTVSPLLVWLLTRVHETGLRVKKTVHHDKSVKITITLVLNSKRFETD